MGVTGVEIVDNKLKITLSEGEPIVFEQTLKGNGIDSVILTADYCLKFTYTDGTTDTVGPVRGEKGEKGDGITAVSLVDGNLYIAYGSNPATLIGNVKGEKGDPGVDGKSAYELYKQAYPDYNGSLEDWLASLKGEKGEKGDASSEKTVKDVSFNAAGEMIITYTDGTEVNKGSARSTEYFEFLKKSDGTLEVRFKNEGSFSWVDYEEIIIPSEYKGIPVTSVGSFYKVDCKKVVLPDSIKEIKASAFAYCTSLEEVVLQQGITTIGENAFHGCYKLKSINLEEGLETIENGAFSGTEMLAEITIPKSTVKIGGNAFGYSIIGYDHYYSSLIKAHFLDPDGWTYKSKTVDLSDYSSAAKQLRAGSSDYYFIKK